MFKPISFAVLAVAIGSCAPISEKACLGGDWGAIGLADGKAGKPASMLQSYSETCADFGVAPVQETYLAARAAGLKFYCTPENAYSVGRSGARLANVCSPDLQSAMRPAYDRGNEYFEISEEIDDLNDRIDDLQDLLSSNYSGKLTPAELTQARLISSKIRDLRNDIFRLEIRQRRYDSWP